MTSLRPLRATDLFDLNRVNLDVLTENYHLSFYLGYLSTWPTLCFASTGINKKRLTGYMIGKTEGRGKDWHGHITCLTVDKDYRRLGLGKLLCDTLAIKTENDPYNGYFVDLFVRANNELAIDMYRRFGYSVYRRVVGYYSPNSSDTSNNNNNNLSADAFDMRKPLKRDINKQSIRENGENYKVSPQDVYF